MIDLQVLAFDFGLQRIGVATGNSLLKISHPLDTVSGKNKFEKLDNIARLIETWHPKLLLVGIPSYSEDKKELIFAIRKFAYNLHRRFKLPVEFINEDYTSSIASMKLSDQLIYGRAQKAKLDELAACEILDRYFNQVLNS